MSGSTGALLLGGLALLLAGGARGCGGPPRLACVGEGLAALPVLSPQILALDVSWNNISEVPPRALSSAPLLRDLNLSGNLGVRLAAGALAGAALVRLGLASCGLSAAPPALAPLTKLRHLSLADNQLGALAEGWAPPLPSLHSLDLRRSRITALAERAFSGQTSLRQLRLDGNHLVELPAALRLLPSLEELSMAGCGLDCAGPDALAGLTRLARLDLRRNPLGALHPRALDGLPRLHTALLSDGGLRALPALNGSERLRALHVDRAHLTSLPPQLCRHAPRLRLLDLKLNQFEEIPDLRACSELRTLDLSSNRISSLWEEEGSALTGLRRLQDLLLPRNRLRRVPAPSFVPTPDLQMLNLEGNGIEHIDMEAFVPISKLEDLNVGNNLFPVLPASGLQRLRHLRAHNNPHLRNFHPPESFPRIQTLVLSYAYHCCEFLPLEQEPTHSDADTAEERFSDVVLVPSQHVDAAAWANASDVWPLYLNVSGGMGVNIGGVGARLAAPAVVPTERHVRCLPRPGPFLPCEDLFDWWTLRCGVWAVFLLALMGNGTVVFVLLWSRSRLDVPRFLVTNLAAADFCMGAYLGLLAVVDAGTLGEFRAHAVAWQLSGACRLAGFLGVLSTELSVFTLAVITLERNYAITHAMHLNKRLSLRAAGAVMAVGWGLSALAAAMPLIGISDYRQFAVCLPFDTGSTAALSYVVTLLIVNGVAFLVLLGCYLKMYCAIRGSQAWNSNDSRIAKRMALLVFTDFLCWAPIALCALTAAFGAPIVSLEEAKVLTVFVLPLNSCCNPFLYAILTKQFKKDCALVCKAIEESRVTRGIGRCRHSSNFSNRQTPANTSSLADREVPRVVPCACSATGAGGERLLRWLRGVRPTAAAGPRGGSVSSSVEFSSSRSDSWRCGRAPPPPRRAAEWLVARKTSQDSNLSSSRNDSSGSNATASTGTWRTSRSAGGARPRLTRQPALCAEDPPPGSPLAPRLLHTIPSAAEPETAGDDAPTPLLATP